MRKILSVLFILSIIGILLTGKANADAPIQLSLVNPIQIVHEGEDVKGVRFNVIYGVNDDVSGIDIGLINKSKGYQKGIQLGIYNSTLDFSGLQLGLINRTDWLDGIQIGLINIHAEGERNFFPIINFAF
ncbi:MAG: hypothetical protein P9X22_08060 [Candidatus Zapsychrus exili]|nr:hypothetical protein [Candidatus Zapsychrus exili]